MRCTLPWLWSLLSTSYTLSAALGLGSYSIHRTASTDCAPLFSASMLLTQDIVWRKADVTTFGSARAFIWLDDNNRKLLGYIDEDFPKIELNFFPPIAIVGEQGSWEKDVFRSVELCVPGGSLLGEHDEKRCGSSAVRWVPRLFWVLPHVDECMLINNSVETRMVYYISVYEMNARIILQV